ncbi:hypothetical protein [Neoroseomonas rubea]|uniref:hypothetical protein n=1 Tax=Neoroseomonas rubea TaxID=2748666 RepID=UPI0018E00E3E|nr:hypothetical protein [Roseomonas rubea]
MTEVALATSVPPAMRRPGPGGEDAGPAWRDACLASWPAPGWRVLALTPPEEAKEACALPTLVEAMEAAPGVAARYGRPGVWLADALARAAGTGAEVVGIVNADIRLDLCPARRTALAGLARDSLVACHRMEVAHAAQAEGPFYRYGFDLVLMPAAIVTRLDLGDFAFGVPWWDYWILLDAMLEGIEVSVVECPGVRHLTHGTAWRRDAWLAALREVTARIARRREALAPLGLGPVAAATGAMLLALSDAEDEGYGLSDLLERAGTRFGLEIVRAAQRKTLRLD